MAKNSPPEEPKPSYIRKCAKGDETVQLTCRIPVATKKRIDKATALLRKYGEDMQLVDIVRAALDEAAEYVERHYHDGCRPAGANSTDSPPGDASV